MSNKNTYIQHDLDAEEYTNKHIIKDIPKEGNSLQDRAIIENSKSYLAQLYTLQDINDNIDSIRSWLQIIAILLLILICRS